MIISLEELQKMSKFSNYDADELKRELKAVEQAIRSYTNNNFQARGKRIEAVTANGLIQGFNKYFKVGDTLQISKSQNAGLYVIKEIAADTIKVDGELYDEAYNLVTKIEYPDDVTAGALRLLDWKLTQGDKVGVQSESISRHSVTYFNMDGDNSVMGYPKSLFGFLKPYRKARF